MLERWIRARPNFGGATIERMPPHVTRAYFRRALARLREQSTATAEAADALAAKADRILASRNPELARHRAQGAAPPVGAQPPCQLAAASPERPAAAADF